jgi:uncharacterized protein (UPF0332 family)
MIEKFQFYIDSNLAKKETLDPEEAKSLMEKSLLRLRFIKSLRIDELNSTFIFEEAYECMREASQSLMSLKGFKPYSHEALIAFIKEFYKFDESDISTFDRYRILRNNCVYRAAKVSPIICKDAVKFAEIFLSKIKAAFDKQRSMK